LEKAINLFSYSQLAGSLAVAIVCLQTEDRIPVLGPGSSSTVDCPPQSWADSAVGPEKSSTLNLK